MYQLALFFRYNYWTPKNVKRQNLKARKDGRTSPFVTMWYVSCFCTSSMTSVLCVFQIACISTFNEIEDFVQVWTIASPQ